jgi:hypothetical protein
MYPVARFCFVVVIAALLFVIGSVNAKVESFKPGQVWLDTDKAAIKVHGGGMLYDKGRYYWFGDFKQGRTWLPESNASWNGVRTDLIGVGSYSSDDLLNWRNEGIVLAAVADNPTHDLHTSKVAERPKVVYNARTKKYVMWMHIDTMDYQYARCGVAVSDKVTGPYKYLTSMRPNKGIWPVNVTNEDKKKGRSNFLARDFKTGQMARDMTVFVDDDGKAYLFYASEENATMHISLLTDDYLGLSGTYKRVFIGRSMEAPAVFKRGQKYYFIGSGCTGWAPNPARAAVADSIWGPWKEIGNPCVGAGAEKTFFSQSTYVLPVEGKKDGYIFMADRWNSSDLSDSRYVWLPIFFEGDRLVIKWFDHWNHSVFDEN